MSNPAENPYLDPSLMDAYVTFSPSENSKYLKDHVASKNTQQLAATNTTAMSQQPQIINQGYQPYNQHHANSQQPAIIDQDIFGIPIGDDPDQPPLCYEELSELKEGDIIWILADEDEESEEAWSRVVFIKLEQEGFMVKNSLNEDEFFPTSCDDDMPVIYKEVLSVDNQKNDENMNSNGAKLKDYTLKDFEYKRDAKIFVYDDANNFVPYTIKAYDAKTTKAELQDNCGAIKQVYLKQFKHEAANKGATKKLDITKPKKGQFIGNNEADKGRLGKFIPLSSINGHWNWVQRTNSMKLKWISYKNTLLGTIAGATKHLYPISLDYKTLMFISGNGLGFHWMDIDVEDDDEEEKQVQKKEDIIGDHMKLFLGDSQMDNVLMRISKYSHYKFERHVISEILYDKDSIKRLMELEQRVVRGLNNNVCSITNDENGHLALIVGYVNKPTINLQQSGSPTMYYFKIKKFGVYDGTKEQNEKLEYVAIDLYNQHFVITMDPPNKDKKYSLQHTFDPQMLLNIVSDLIENYQQKQDNPEQEIDLFGGKALQQMSNEMKKAKSIHPVSNTLAKLTVFAIIRLFDARKTSIEFIEYVQAKINNAFHSQTGADVEWKFNKEFDISSELKKIETSLKAECSAIRRQQKLYETYVFGYDGNPLNNVEWEPVDRAGLKAACDEIIDLEDKIFANLKGIKEKLSRYQQLLKK